LLTAEIENKESRIESKEWRIELFAAAVDEKGKQEVFVALELVA